MDKENQILRFIWAIVPLLLVTGCLQTGEPVDQTPSAPDLNIKQPDTQSISLDDRTFWQKPNLVLDYFGNLENKTVADIGAGSGFFSIRLAARGAKVLALEIDPRALQTIDEVINLPNYPVEYRSNIEMRLVKEDDPKLENDKVDAILISNTITFIKDRSTYLQKIFQYLQPGGKILIVDYKMTRLPFDIPLEERVPLHIIEDELIQSGFINIIHDQCALDYQYIITGQKPVRD